MLASVGSAQRPGLVAVAAVFPEFIAREQPGRRGLGCSQLDPQVVAHHLRRGQGFAAAHLPGEHLLRCLQHLVGVGWTVVARDITNEKG